MSITEWPRAGFYVDGFNLYHAIDDLKKPYLKWLSLRRLADRISSQNKVKTEEIVFCTAYFPGDFNKRKRHEAYVNALIEEDVRVLFGHTTKEPSDCRSCGHMWDQPREKETDINVALSLYEAARSKAIDVAFLITADTDQAATLKFVKRYCDGVQVITLTPPRRSSATHLKDNATRTFKLSETDLDLSVLPPMIQPSNGRLIVRPREYTPPKGWMHPDERRK